MADVHPVRVVIVGAGAAVAPSHFRAFCQVADVIAGVDPDAAARHRVAHAYHVPVYETLAEALAHEPAPNLAVVCVRDELHASVATEAIGHGLSVHVEKPLVTDLHSAAALYALAAQHGVHLSVAMQRRHELRDIAALIASGELGRTRRVAMHWYTAHPPPAWRRTATGRAGVIADLHIHLLGQALPLCGDVEPVRVTARAWHTAGYSIEDAAHLAIECTHDALITLDAGYARHTAAGDDIAAHIITDRATIQTPLLSLHTQSQAARYSLRPRLSHPTADAGRPRLLSPLLTREATLTMTAQHVADAVRNGRTASDADAHRELVLIALLEAAYASVERGAPVPVPSLPDPVTSLTDLEVV